jgi:prepilin-type processing-associated H-X9-DG protein
MRRPIAYGLLAVLALLVLACCGLAAPLDFVVALVVGWVMFLARVLPRVRVDWAGVATAVVCLTLFAVGSHAFLRWLYGQVPAEDGSPDPSARRWKPRWTVALVVAVVTMFVAGISAAGVAHQVGWLLTAGEPLVDSSMRRIIWRAQSTNNLKLIGIALHNYHEAHASFPPGGTFDARGQALHGWPARLLPYVERQDLYDRIDFGLPWDNLRNRPAFQTVVAAYRNHGLPETRDASGYALIHYAGNARLLGGDVPRTWQSVTDGASSTLMAGEVVGAFRSWGDPVNWREPALGINRSRDGFGSPFPGGANFLFVDGSVRFLKNTTDPRVLKALSTPAGGEPVPPDVD